VRKIGTVLLLLGGFLVMTAVLAQWYMPPRIEKTPLDVDETIHLAGTGTINDKTFPIKVASVYHADTSLSTSTVISFVQSTCVVKDVNNPPQCVNNKDPQKRLITASVDHYATDRHTAEAVNDSQYLPPDATPHEGLQNKFPFHVSKTASYRMWDPTAKAAYPLVYAGSEKLDGLETYRFTVQASNVPIELAPGVNGTYTNDQVYWVEPVTGSIVKNSQDLVQKDLKDNPVVALTFEYTSAQVADSVDKAKTDRDKLNLLLNTVPVVAFVIGVPALLLGLFLVVRRREKPSEPASPEPALQK
jgi:hypothetical protein